MRRVSRAAAALALVPGLAHAHAIETGLGPLLDGATHFFASVDDLLPVVAMALLAGMNGARAARLAVVVLPSAWLAAGLAGHAAGAVPLPAATPSVSLLVLGILVALDRRLPTALVAVVAGIVGAMHGALNGAALAQDGRGWMAVAGIAAGSLVAMALVAPPASRVEGGRARLSLRVFGSWIAAIGLLYLGWRLSGRG